MQLRDYCRRLKMTVCHDRPFVFVIDLVWSRLNSFFKSLFFWLFFMFLVVDSGSPCRRQKRDTTYIAVGSVCIYVPHSPFSRSPDTRCPYLTKTKKEKKENKTADDMPQSFI